MPKPPLLDVEGQAFTRAREAHANIDENLRGDVSGTQEWLADKASVSLRTIQKLEEGKASLKTIDSVSTALEINGRAYIIGYGSRYTQCQSPGVIDFRSIVYGEEDAAYLDRPFAITIDPIIINYDDDFTDSVMLNAIYAKLSIDDLEIKFKWLYLVELTAASQGWLGYKSSVFPTQILKKQPYAKSVMLKQQEDEPVSWGEILNRFTSSEAESLTLEIMLKFEYFDKFAELSIPISKLSHDCFRAQTKYNLAGPYPYFMQQEPCQS